MARASVVLLVSTIGSLALAACGSTGGGVQSPGSSYAGPKAGNYGPAQGLIGADARRLVGFLGQPRLDIRDPGVRKMQFANGRCVLDAYLYAPTRGREPVTTHVDVRRLTGETADAGGCGFNLPAN